MSDIDNERAESFMEVNEYWDVEVFDIAEGWETIESFIGYEDAIWQADELFQDGEDVRITRDGEVFYEKSHGEA